SSPSETARAPGRTTLPSGVLTSTRYDIGRGHFRSVRARACSPARAMQCLAHSMHLSAATDASQGAHRSHHLTHGRITEGPVMPYVRPTNQGGRMNQDFGRRYDMGTRALNVHETQPDPDPGT